MYDKNESLSFTPPHTQGRHVLILGNGKSALDCTVEMSLGGVAKHVTVVYRTVRGEGVGWGEGMCGGVPHWCACGGGGACVVMYRTALLLLCVCGGGGEACAVVYHTVVCVCGGRGGMCGGVPHCCVCGGGGGEACDGGVPHVTGGGSALECTTWCACVVGGSLCVLGFTPHPFQTLKRWPFYTPFQTLKHWPFFYTPFPPPPAPSSPLPGALALPPRAGRQEHQGASVLTTADDHASALLHSHGHGAHAACRDEAGQEALLGKHGQGGCVCGGETSQEAPLGKHGYTGCMCGFAC